MNKHTWKIRLLKVTVAVGLVAALAGCGGGGTDAKGTGAANAVVVNLESTAFSSKTIEVAAGTTVKWINKDQVDHSIWEGKPDSGQYLFHSDDFGNGQEFSHTFDKPGTYEIFCNTASHHLLGMTMQVVVK